LRPNHGVDGATLLAALGAAGVEVEPVEAAGVLRWTGGESPFGTEPFRTGRFVAQDPTALAAAEAVPCGPGAAVVDLCAAPGTKTTWLAGKVRPGGRVYAFDPDERRRLRIAENVARMQLGEVVRLVTRPEDLPPAEAVLADVPCSNSGVLGRRVEVRRRITAAAIEGMAELQRKLLHRALRLVLPGGHAVYSTCSIDREENEAVVAAVLADASLDGGFEVVRSELTLPLAGSRDGGYFAVIRRGRSGG
ncbi:MAG: hypothetical protein KDC98_07080, partial [Planctomycetes bacterium]|nr:hypothetical protein [Planctomycetota bacterium]